MLRLREDPMLAGPDISEFDGCPCHCHGEYEDDCADGLHDPDLCGFASQHLGQPCPCVDWGDQVCINPGCECRCDGYPDQHDSGCCGAHRLADPSEVGRWRGDVILAGRPLPLAPDGSVNLAELRRQSVELRGGYRTGADDVF